MRNRINSNLVATSSDSTTKRKFAVSNRQHEKKFFMTVFGVKKRITRDEYERLRKVGLSVEEIC